MGLFDFVAAAGKKVLPQPISPGAAAANVGIAAALKTHIQNSGVNIQGLDVQIGPGGEVQLSGQAASRADYEKAALAAGNVMHVSKVDNNISVDQTAAAEPEAQTYTVKSGDSLSKIAKQFYGDANAYPRIFEANQPLIKDANEIYPGQVLRIPAA